MTAPRPATSSPQLVLTHRNIEGHRRIAAAKINVVYGGTADTKGTIVGAWVQVPASSYNLANAKGDADKFGYFADTTTTNADGVYNFTGLTSFVYVEQAAGGATTVYQPGTTGVRMASESMSSLPCVWDASPVPGRVATSPVAGALWLTVTPTTT